MTEVSKMDIWMMLLSTIRYSIGRTSYMPSMTIDLIKRYSDSLEDHQLAQIKREVEYELRIEEQHKGHMGWECDVQTWKNFVITLDKIIEKRS